MKFPLITRFYMKIPFFYSTNQKFWHHTTVWRWPKSRNFAFLENGNREREGHQPFGRVQETIRQRFSFRNNGVTSAIMQATSILDGIAPANTTVLIRVASKAAICTTVVVTATAQMSHSRCC